MASQTVTNQNNLSSFNGPGGVIKRVGQTVAQDAARTTPIANLTVMARDSDGYLIPLDDNTALDGTQIPVGIIEGTIPAADIVAADVTNQNLYVSGKFFNESDIVLEGSLTLASEITVSAIPTAIATIAEADGVDVTIAAADATGMTIANDDATDLATALTLVNEIKAAINTNYPSMVTLANEVKTDLNADLPNTVALANAVKSAINTAVAAGNVTSMTITIREYLQLMGILTRTADTVAGYENSAV